MTVEVQNTFKNVVALKSKRLKTAYWTLAHHFQPVDIIPSANDNYAPIAHEGAQTSEHLLEFLYGVAR